MPIILVVTPIKKEKIGRNIFENKKVENLGGLNSTLQLFYLLSRGGLTMLLCFVIFVGGIRQKV